MNSETLWWCVFLLVLAAIEVVGGLLMFVAFYKVRYISNSIVNNPYAFYARGSVAVHAHSVLTH